MVLGHHPHVLQPLKYYKGKPILYSLGNFCGIGYDDERSKSALLLTTWRGRKCLKAERIPIRLVDGVPELVKQYK
jgi:poly-gamma-glutamate synthesis protein (capsule biosynthesis protein)